jgi:NAD(P)-dependent dehydrogenase (short-subunit alcohol dehydrogenase family)
MAVLNASNIRGRVFMVTGCTHGLGKETARQLARRGATGTTRQIHRKHMDTLTNTPLGMPEWPFTGCPSDRLSLLLKCQECLVYCVTIVCDAPYGVVCAVLLASRDPKLVAATAAEFRADCPEADLHELHLNLA